MINLPVISNNNRDQRKILKPEKIALLRDIQYPCEKIQDSGDSGRIMQKRKFYQQAQQGPNRTALGRIRGETPGASAVCPTAP